MSQVWFRILCPYLQNWCFQYRNWIAKSSCSSCLMTFEVGAGCLKWDLSQSWDFVCESWPVWRCRSSAISSSCCQTIHFSGWHHWLIHSWKCWICVELCSFGLGLRQLYHFHRDLLCQSPSCFHSPSGITSTSIYQAPLFLALKCQHICYFRFN